MDLFILLLGLLASVLATAQDVFTVPSACTSAALRNLVNRVNVLPNFTGAVLCSSWNQKYVTETGMFAHPDHIAYGRR